MFQRDEQLQQAFFLIRAIIRRMTTDAKFVVMKSMEQFNEWIQQQKYSWFGPNST